MSSKGRAILGSVGPAVGLDRCVLTSHADPSLPENQLPDFRIEHDYVLRNTDAGQVWSAYERCRQLINDLTNTKLFLNYKPRRRGLAFMRATIVPDDVAKLRRPEFEMVWGTFEQPRLVTAELAMDFPKGTMSAGYVKRHWKLGHARIRRNTRYPHAVWHGASRSAQFSRGYPKPEVDGFRVEIQLNIEGLERYEIATPADFERLPEILIAQMGFYRMDWAKLERYARNNLRHTDTILRMARQRRGVLTELLTFLHAVGVSNPQNFLIPMPINGSMYAALRGWGDQWKKDGQGL